MRTVRVEIPREPGHAPLAIVEWEGYQWLVVEVDTADGVTVLERGVPEESLPTTRTEVVRVRRWAWPPAIVAVCSVFLFLALMASVGTRLTFADVVGCIFGFVVLVLLLDRREGTRPPASEEYRTWWWL